MKKKLLSFILVVAMMLTAVAALTACDYRYTGSKPMPVDTVIFVRNFGGRASTEAVIIHDGAAYVGNLIGGLRDDGTAYAKLGNHFSRLTLENNGYFYRVTNSNTLWASAWVHDAYPQGLIFNRDGSVSWIHVMSYDGFRGAYIRYDGIRWPVSRLVKLNDIELYRFENEPPVPPEEDNYFGDNWHGRNSNIAFSITGVYIDVAMGAQVASPANLRVANNEWGHRVVAWNTVPNVRQYYVYSSGSRIATTSNTEIILTGSHFVQNAGAGTHAIEVVAPGRREIIRGIITHFPDSRPAVINITIHADGTIS